MMNRRNLDRLRARVEHAARRRGPSTQHERIVLFADGRPALRDGPAVAPSPGDPPPRFATPGAEADYRRLRGLS